MSNTSGIFELAFRTTAQPFGTAFGKISEPFYYPLQMTLSDYSNAARYWSHSKCTRFAFRVTSLDRTDISSMTLYVAAKHPSATHFESMWNWLGGPPPSNLRNGDTGTFLCFQSSETKDDYIIRTTTDSTPAYPSSVARWQVADSMQQQAYFSPIYDDLSGNIYEFSFRLDVTFDGGRQTRIYLGDPEMTIGGSGN